MTSNANDFRHQSGVYELVLVVGDALLQTPFEWKLNDNLQLTFHEDSVADQDHQDLYSPKQEIIHQFRKDEPRPAAIVSLVFSALTLLPLLILLVLVRARVENVPSLHCLCLSSGLNLVLIFRVYHWDSVH